MKSRLDGITFIFEDDIQPDNYDEVVNSIVGKYHYDVTALEFEARIESETGWKIGFYDTTPFPTSPDEFAIWSDDTGEPDGYQVMMREQNARIEAAQKAQQEKLLE